MARYECTVCGYVYDEASEGSLWSSLPDSWSCPICGSPKSHFQLVAPDAPAATSRAALAHRIFGYVFLAIYLVLIVQMVPRLWTYQIEFPARTVVHIALGMAVGVVLLLKIAIVRFFRRLDQELVPLLGTAVLVSSFVLIGISVPSAFQEAFATGRLFTPENRERVQTLLAQTGLDEEECVRLASTDSLRRPAGPATGLRRMPRFENRVGQTSHAPELAADGATHGRPHNAAQPAGGSTTVARHRVPRRIVATVAAISPTVERCRRSWPAGQRRSRVRFHSNNVTGHLRSGGRKTVVRNKMFTMPSDRCCGPCTTRLGRRGPRAGRVHG